MKKWLQLGAVLALKIAVLCLYVRGVSLGVIRPTFPSLAIITVAVTIAFWAFLKRDRSKLREDLPANVSNTIDVALVWTMSVVVCCWGKGENMAFKPFDLLCATLAGLIVLYWWVWGKHLRTNFFMQGVMVVAYFPLFSNLLHAKTNPESFFYWGGSLAAEIFSLKAALQGKRIEAKVYSLRAAAFILITMGLMLRITLSN